MAQHVECKDIFDIIQECSPAGEIYFKLFFKGSGKFLGGEGPWGIRFRDAESAEWEGDRWIRMNYERDQRIADVIFEKEVLKP